MSTNRSDYIAPQEKRVADRLRLTTTSKLSPTRCGKHAEDEMGEPKRIGAKPSVSSATGTARVTSHVIAPVLLPDR